MERAFTLDLWRSHWLSILREMLPAKTQRRAKTVKSLVFPYTGIPWEGIKQRPHHIANEFVERGYEIFWGDPAGRRTPAPHIHLLNFNDELYLKNALILIYYPYNYEEITKFSDPIVIFDNLDDISIFDHVTWDDPGKTARDYYALLIQDADIVMTSSRVLLSKICQSLSGCNLCPKWSLPRAF